MSKLKVEALEGRELMAANVLANANTAGKPATDSVPVATVFFTPPIGSNKGSFCGDGFEDKPGVFWLERPTFALRPPTLNSREPMIRLRIEPLECRELAAANVTAIPQVSPPSGEANVVHVATATPSPGNHRASTNGICAVWHD